MKFEVMKNEEGTLVIEGIPLIIAMHLRRLMEGEFDAIVRLTVTTNDHTILLMRGASDEPLGEDETAEKYRMWLQGWYCGWQDDLERYP